MATTLVKTKIVLENDGKNLVVYMWKKVFFIFGYWYPYGSSSSLGKIAKKKIERINADTMAVVMYDNFIKRV